MTKRASASYLFTPETGTFTTINTIIAPGWSLQKMLTLANLAVNVVRMGAQLRIPYDKGIRCCYNYKNGIMW